MIQCRQMNDDGFVEIRFTAPAAGVYGARISYRSAADADFRPCAILPARDAAEEALADNGSFWNWNEAVRSGIVRFDRRPDPVYWNLYLNGLHGYNGALRLRVEVLRVDGSVAVHDQDIELAAVKAVYMDNWQTLIGPDSGWSLEEGHLTVQPGTKAVKPIVLKPGLQGRYMVWIGTPGEPGSLGDLGILIKASDNPARYFMTKGWRPGLNSKTVELPWRIVDFTPETELEIGIGWYQLRVLDRYPFGRLAYVKFAPVRRAKPRIATSWSDKKLALHFEPGSWVYSSGLSSPEHVRQVLEQLREMGMDEVHTQVIRLGSRTMHESRVVDQIVPEPDRNWHNDDGTIFSGAEFERLPFDVLREAIRFSRELGICHYANAGMTVCYVGTPMEDRFSREHPEWRHGDMGFLSYCHPETRAYAAAVIREFVEWGTDGVSIDCMRYPYGQSTDDLIALFTELSLAIRQSARGKRIPLAARIPDGNITYFQAFDRLIREGHVQCVIPSTLMPGPVHSLKPYLKWKDFGCKVYGRLEAWKTYLWRNQSILFTPSEIRREIRRLFREGADGIYAYQADAFLADPFNRTALNWRKW